MDKFLLSLLLSLLAGFLTAIGTFVKLVNDKESKVTEFRQQWTESARQALADLISNLRNSCALIGEAVDLDGDMTRIVKHLSNKEKEDKQQDSILKTIFESESASRETLTQAFRENRANIVSSLSLAKLHFKVMDEDFAHIESKVASALKNIDDWNLTKTNSADLLRGTVEPLVEEITNYSRKILKGEWEKIKGGEPAYRKTRFWAKTGGLLGAGALLVLLAWIGIERLLAWKEETDRVHFSTVNVDHKAMASTPTENQSASSVRNSSEEHPTPAAVAIVQQISTERGGPSIASNKSRAIPHSAAQCTPLQNK